MSPTVLLDVDEVMIDWMDGFSQWMGERGYRRDVAAAHHWDLRQHYPGLAWVDLRSEIDAFAHSGAYRNMPLRSGVKREVVALKAAGCQVVAVTSCGRAPAIVSNRVHQLRELPLDDIRCLDHEEDKAVVYQAAIPGAVVVDDAPHHLRRAVHFGHAAMAYAAPWNRDVDCDDVMPDWKFGAIRIIRLLRCRL